MNFNWSYSPETPNLGQIRRFWEPSDLEIWRMTFKNNRAPLLSNIKLYVSFHHHMGIQTGVTVRKRLRWVVTSVALTFDLWPWPFAWTLPWSLVITPWWYDDGNIVKKVWRTDRRTDRQTDGQTDRQTENTIHRAAWSQLKRKRNGTLLVELHFFNEYCFFIRSTWIYLHHALMYRTWIYLKSSTG